jgi:hypothetical protein
VLSSGIEAVCDVDAFVQALLDLPRLTDQVAMELAMKYGCFALVKGYFDGSGSRDCYVADLNFDGGWNVLDIVRLQV